MFAATRTFVVFGLPLLQAIFTGCCATAGAHTWSHENVLTDDTEEESDVVVSL